MSDVDELLRRNLKALSEPVDRARLLDEVTRRRNRRLRMRRAQAGVLAIVVVAGTVLGTYALLGAFRGEADPVVATGCGRPLPFEPGYLPADWLSELRPGSYGGYGAIGHYVSRNPGGGAVDIQHVERWWEEFERGRPISVLGREALMGRFYDGAYWVTFPFRGCRYMLWGYANVGRETMRRFAEGLRPSS